MDKTIIVHTDGGASPNPGPGGYAAVLQFGDKYKEISGGFRLTTNNRMELSAVIVALQSLKTKEYPIKLYSDSKYIVDAINLKWIEKWEAKNYKKVKNPDLWQQMADLLKKYKVKFIWVKGHSGIEHNERSDKLVQLAMDKSDLKIDEYYEKNQEPMRSL